MRVWPVVLAGCGCVAVLPWLLVTSLETDGADAIWAGSPWNTVALALVGIGALAAVVAMERALQLRESARGERVVVAALAVEALAAAAWLVVAFLAVD